MKNIDCLAGVGAAYHGSVNQTRSGYTCQAWNMQTPDTHDLAELGEHTYCRGEKHGSWCYTTNENKEWEYCSIKLCMACDIGDQCGASGQ